MEANSNRITKLDPGEFPLDFYDDADDVEAPEAEGVHEFEGYPFLTWISPSTWFPIVLSWAEDWIVSRQLLFLLAGTPFIILVVILGSWILNLGASRNDAVSFYEQALRTAETQGNRSMQEISLRALVGLRLGDAYRLMQVVDLYWSTERRQEAWDLVSALAIRGEHGIPEAHLWIVRNAMSGEPFQKISDRELIRHLQEALVVNPENAQAHMLLAARYSENREWQLAEKHLQAAAERDSTFLIPLIRFRESIGRSEANAETLQKALKSSSAKLEKNPASSDARIELGQVLLMHGRVKEAKKLIEEGRTQKDLPDYRRALAMLNVKEAEFLLSQTILNRDQCVPLMAEALKLEPFNADAVRVLEILRKLGVTIPVTLVDETLKNWSGAFQADPENPEKRMAVVRLLSLSGQPSKAADLLLPVVAQYPRGNCSLVEFLVQALRTEEARTISEAAVLQAESNRGSLESVSIAAECLISLGEYARARKLLQTDSGAVPGVPILARLYGISCLREFDAIASRPVRTNLGPDRWLPSVEDPADAENLLQLLTDASSIGVVRADVTDRLVRLILCGCSVSGKAEVRLMQMQAQGISVPEILNQMGSHALLHEQHAKAFQWLDRANSLTPEKNPVILNNLALAVLRGKLDTPDRALAYINEALKLLPGNPELLSTRGEVLIAMNDWNAALQDLEQSLQVRSGRPKVHRLLNVVWKGLNNPERAEEQQRLADALEKTAVERQ